MLTCTMAGLNTLMTSPVIAAERAATPEKNPPGDIPDTQVFVNFQSPLGFSVQIPEGWSRSERKNGVAFADNFNKIEVKIGTAVGAPSVTSTKTQQAVELVNTGRAVVIKAIKSVSLPAGSAVLIDFESNSEPNQVTKKQLRLESNRYLIFTNGRLATLDLSAPKGADNVDQWKLIAHSFHWN